MSCRRLGYLTNSLWVRYTKPLPVYWDARVRWQMPKSCFWLGGGYTSTGIGRFEFYVLSKCLGKHTQLVLGVAAEHNFSPYLGGIGPTAEGNLGGYFVR